MDCTKLEAEIPKIAVDAGLGVMEIYRSSGVKTRRKGDGSPVTLADTTADSIIRTGLQASFPEIAIVSEECPDSHNLRADRYFLVDPLDGTRGFARGASEFTVNIALIENGVPVSGVIYAPKFGSLVCTAADGGVSEYAVPPGRGFSHAELQELRAGRERNGLRIVASRSSSERDRLASFLVPYLVENVTRISSSIKFCQVALGHAGLYPRFGATMEWDTAAGHAIVRAAGGRVVRLDNREALAYGKRGYLNPGFVVCGPGVKLQAED